MLLWPLYGPGVDEATNRNEYQKILLVVKRGRPKRNDDVTAICEPIV
jgi:hypothetical protein